MKRGIQFPDLIIHVHHENIKQSEQRPTEKQTKSLLRCPIYLQWFGSINVQSWHVVYRTIYNTESITYNNAVNSELYHFFHVEQYGKAMMCQFPFADKKWVSG